MKFNKLTAVLSALVLTVCMTAPLTVFPEEEPSEKIRVMPLGDSITDGFTGQPVGGYRLTLWNELEKDGYTDRLDFVGPNWGGDGIDPNHAGYSGYAIDDIPNQRLGIYPFSEWLMENYPADVVLLQIGTNDIISNYKRDSMGERLELLVDVVLNALPENGLLYLSTIPYMDADVTTYTDAYTAEEMDKAVDDYNAQVKALVLEKQAEGKPIVQADINSVLTKEDLLDGVHPNADGYEKMGLYWKEQLENYLNQQNHTEPDFLLGDVTLDSKINLQDIILLQKYLLGKEKISQKAFQNADMNQDSLVNIYDLIALKKQLLGKIIFIDDPVS